MTSHELLLPNELLVEIFKNLSDDELQTVSHVNWHWKALFREHLGRAWAVRKIEEAVWPRMRMKRGINIFSFKLKPATAYQPSGTSGGSRSSSYFNLEWCG